MDRDFSWNLPSIEDIREKREREQLGLMESERLKAQRALQMQNALEGAQQAQQAQMADQAQYARWLELEDKFAKRTMDPRMKMGAMLAMAGQPGLLQQMFMTGGESSKEAQSEMDSLESSIANDMFALAGADSATYDKLTGALIPLYKSKFNDLLARGARSRMGSTWDEGWGVHLSRGKQKRNAAKKKREEDRKNLRSMLPE
jgi:hypothetical protein